jgi:glycosidase
MTRNPSLYQVNTRVWLTALSRDLGRTATLDDIPDSELDRFGRLGFDWIWMLSVWQTSAMGQRVSRSSPVWRREFEETLPDLQEGDIGGSGFAIAGYTAHPSLGGDAALAHLRSRLRTRGLKLMLDFVPNHTALDHPWAQVDPEYYVPGTEADLERAPQNYTRITRPDGDVILAHGRDPFFPGWPDTLQLDYSNPTTQGAMIAALTKIAGQCDGVRCDMAMLLLPDVFERTWGRQPQPFWPRAIRSVRERFPDFRFLAEVYWDLEWVMQQLGFDSAYDKRLYDRLRDRYVRPVRDHLRAGLAYQERLARFLENHDEPRAAATFPPAIHEAAAVITFLSPGLRFFHQGQFEGRLKRISPHLVRAPIESPNEELQQFYNRFLPVAHRAAVRAGQWQLLDCAPAWDGNWTWDNFLAFAWRGPDQERLLVIVNYADHQGQCYVPLPFEEMAGRSVRLVDLMSSATYDRDGSDLVARGLYLDIPGWSYHVFEVSLTY